MPPTAPAQRQEVLPPERPQKHEHQDGRRKDQQLVRRLEELAFLRQQHAAHIQLPDADYARDPERQRAQFEPRPRDRDTLLSQEAGPQDEKHCPERSHRRAISSQESEIVGAHVTAAPLHLLWTPHLSNPPSMAVYTDIDDTALTALLTEYDLGPPLAFKGIAEGVENSNFLLETPKGRYILTVFEKRAKPEDLPFFMGMMSHLAEKGFPAPLPVPARDGQALRTIQGKPAVIATFLQGMSPRRPDINQCRKLGIGLARFHRALDDFRMRRPNDLSITSWPKRLWAAARPKPTRSRPASPRRSPATSMS